MRVKAALLVGEEGSGGAGGGQEVLIGDVRKASMDTCSSTCICFVAGVRVSCQFGYP